MGGYPFIAGWFTMAANPIIKILDDLVVPRF